MHAYVIKKTHLNYPLTTQYLKHFSYYSKNDLDLF